MEKFPIITSTESAPEKAQVHLEKSEIFDTLVINELIEAFINDLAEADFEPEQIEAFEKELGNHSEEEIKTLLALPKELRLRTFPRYKELLDKKLITIEGIISKIIQQGEERGYTLGYHVSPSEIMPNEKGEWIIKSTELDDRDNRLMAYYSLDYQNIYRADRGNNLYVIRAETSPLGTHKKDTSNNWGRADSLSIVQELDLIDLDEQVEKLYKEQIEQEHARSEKIMRKGAA